MNGLAIARSIAALLARSSAPASAATSLQGSSSNTKCRWSPAHRSKSGSTGITSRGFVVFGAVGCTGARAAAANEASMLSICASRGSRPSSASAPSAPSSPRFALPLAYACSLLPRCSGRDADEMYCVFISHSALDRSGRFTFFFRWSTMPVRGLAPSPSSSSARSAGWMGGRSRGARNAAATIGSSVIPRSETSATSFLRSSSRSKCEYSVNESVATGTRRNFQSTGTGGRSFLNSIGHKNAVCRFNRFSGRADPFSGLPEGFFAADPLDFPRRAFSLAFWRSLRMRRSSCVRGEGDRGARVRTPRREKA